MVHPGVAWQQLSTSLLFITVPQILRFLAFSSHMVTPTSKYTSTFHLILIFCHLYFIVDCFGRVETRERVSRLDDLQIFALRREIHSHTFIARFRVKANETSENIISAAALATEHLFEFTIYFFPDCSCLSCLISSDVKRKTTTCYMWQLVKHYRSPTIAPSDQNRAVTAVLPLWYFNVIKDWKVRCHLSNFLI